jgi:hypothetical protein
MYVYKRVTQRQANRQTTDLERMRDAATIDVRTEENRKRGPALGGQDLYEPASSITVLPPLRRRRSAQPTPWSDLSYSPGCRPAEGPGHGKGAHAMGCITDT